jgi:hypothetical protein
MEISFPQVVKDKVQKDRDRIGGEGRPSFLAEAIAATDRDFRRARTALGDFIATHKRDREVDRNSQGWSMIRKYEKEGPSFRFAEDRIAPGSIVVVKHNNILDDGSELTTYGYFWISDGDKKGNFGVPHVFSVGDDELAKLQPGEKIQNSHITYCNYGWRNQADVEVANELFFGAFPIPENRYTKTVEVWTKGQADRGQEKSKEKVRRHSTLFDKRLKPVPIPVA